MILVKVQNRKEIKSIVEECFEGDYSLIEKYHIKSGHSIEECVSDTCNVLKNYTAFDFEFYKVVDKDICGFIGIEPSIAHLTTFCLKKEYRSIENKEKLWNIIVGLFKDGFICGLYKKNDRAINYLLNNGCTIKDESQHNGESIVVLNFKKEVI